MTNKEIANNLFQIAKILELQNSADHFRIVAYERAAQTIENYPDEMADIFKKDGIKGLNDIPGVGESIAEKIEELLKTGKLKYLNEITKNIPVSEVEFLKIPGIGPKMAIKIAKEIKAKNIADLKNKLEKDTTEKYFKIWI